MDNENILTTAGILIIYEDGTYTFAVYVPKQNWFVSGRYIG